MGDLRKSFLQKVFCLSLSALSALCLVYLLTQLAKPANNRKTVISLPSCNNGFQQTLTLKSSGSCVLNPCSPSSNSLQAFQIPEKLVPHDSGDRDG